MLGTKWGSKWDYGMCTPRDFYEAVRSHTCKVR